MESSRIGPGTSTEELTRAIELAEEAVSVTPSDHPDLADMLMYLGELLELRYQKTGSNEDSDRSIEIAEKMIEATPLDHSDRVYRLETLARWSYERFERFRAMQDIERTVKMNQELVRSVSSDDPARAAYLSDLGLALRGRFEETRSLEDLDGAIEAAEGSVAISADHPDRGAYLTNLGGHLGMRSMQTGSLEDLNRAVESSYESIESVSYDHPSRAGFHQNLGVWLEARFERTASMQDLNSAIQIAEESVRAPSTGDDGYEAAARLHNLGNWLGRRFTRCGSIDDLGCAIENIEKSIAAIPSDSHPTLASFLRNLGIWLGARSKQSGLAEDLDRAIHTLRQSRDLTPLGHTDRAGSSRNLSIWLGTRFRRTGSIEDLDEAIEAISEAVNITPADHPAQAIHLTYLGRWLQVRSELLGSSEDLSVALNAFEGAWNCTNARAADRIGAAWYAVGMLASESNWERSSILMQGAVELLPLLSPLTLQHEDKQFLLASSGGIASIAASVALNAGKDAYDALRLLEIGRNVIAGLLLDMRSDVSDLDIAYPDLAARVKSLRDELDSPIDETLPIISNGRNYSKESDLKRRREAQATLDYLIEEMRVQPGFEDFLLPPTAPDLMAAANPDPIIVINLSALRHDAFLVEPHQITVLQLSSLDLGWLENHVQEIERAPHRFLEWLWNVVAGPCLEALGFRTPVTDDDWPHVWWITTGIELSTFPLHAAGMRDIFAGHGRTDALDPSLSALLLMDWEASPLTIRDLRDLKLQRDPPFLAYLSACSTGRNNMSKLEDEGIHLVSACQLAGFRHVIGTFWAVPDEYCSATAETFYETLRDEGMTDGAVYRGIHRAVRALRDKQGGVRLETRDASLVDEDDDPVEGAAGSLESLSWMFYVHFGV
ncbi:MAG: hypothetical protein Q9208_002676 [Pyrenodesmia sp. 3 TL-2023]